jgi:putative hemolysin
MTSYELSYVRPGDPLLRRWLMRAVENLSGRRRLLPIYDRWRKQIAGNSPRMWSEALHMIGTRLEIRAPADWHTRAPSGPLVIIANHPFGIADGISILAVAERLGRPYRILIHADFMQVPEIQALGLPIDFSETKNALRENLRTRARARQLLKEGVTIVVFPSGGVATAENPFGKAEELPWKKFVVRLIQQSDAAVLPVHFEGQNSPLFHFVSRYSETLRLSLLVCEFRTRIGATIKATVGSPIACAAIAGNGGEFIDELYLLVHRLAPGAETADRAALLPRSPDQRRRYPWDSPREKISPAGRQQTAEGVTRSASAESDASQPSSARQ